MGKEYRSGVRSKEYINRRPLPIIIRGTVSMCEGEGAVCCGRMVHFLIEFLW
jgi:hypothetical protein